MERAAAGDPISLIGSSMGGYLAALYAARHPEVARAVLLAPAFGFARRWAERLGPARVEEWRRTGAMYVYHYSEGRDSKRVIACYTIRCCRSGAIGTAGEPAETRGRAPGPREPREIS